jgi:hypothetical protein
MELVRLSLDEASLDVCLVLQLAYLGLHGLLLLLPLKGARQPVRPLGGLHVRGGVCLVGGGDLLCSYLGFGLPLWGLGFSAHQTCTRPAAWPHLPPSSSGSCNRENYLTIN